jgi:lysozyme family protein
MADFKLAVEITLQHEGGYVDNPADPGGATKYGITQRDLPGENIAELTENQAATYYQLHFWPQQYNGINSQVIANKLFDMGVLFGQATAVRVLQQAMGVHVDGVAGFVTIAKINSYGPVTLLAFYQAALAEHVASVITADPKTAAFRQGWLNRVNS